jgi:hypothetical protein
MVKSQGVYLMFKLFTLICLAFLLSFPGISHSDVGKSNGYIVITGVHQDTEGLIFQKKKITFSVKIEREVSRWSSMWKNNYTICLTYKNASRVVTEDACQFAVQKNKDYSVGRTAHAVFTLPEGAEYYDLWFKTHYEEKKKGDKLKRLKKFITDQFE